MGKVAWQQFWLEVLYPLLELEACQVQRKNAKSIDKVIIASALYDKDLHQTFSGQRPEMPKILGRPQQQVFIEVFLVLNCTIIPALRIAWEVELAL